VGPLFASVALFVLGLLIAGTAGTMAAGRPAGWCRAWVEAP
jgi:hypothetical protein